VKVLFVTSCFPSEEKPYYCIYLEQQVQALKKIGNTVDVLILMDSCQEKDWYERNGIFICKLGLQQTFAEKFYTTDKTYRKLNDFPWQNYDVVSLHFGRVAYFNTIAAICVNRKVKVIRHFHGLNVWDEYNPSKKCIYRLYEKFLTKQKTHLLDKCDAMIGVSDLVCAQIRKKYNRGQIYTVYNGVDQHIFSPDINKRERTSFRIVCVANLIVLKGQDYLLEAVATLSKDRDLELLLIGDGVERIRLEKKSEDLGISKRVRFLGEQDYLTVAAYLKKCDMFIMPSCYEAFGCVFVEAMSSGVLTCGCKGTGAEEIITNEWDGLLVTQHSTDSIVQAVCFAMDHRQEAAEIAIRGMERARHFSWIASAKSLQKVYEQVCMKNRT